MLDVGQAYAGDAGLDSTGHDVAFGAVTKMAEWLQIGVVIAATKRYRNDVITGKVLA